MDKFLRLDDHVEIDEDELFRELITTYNRMGLQLHLIAVVAEKTKLKQNISTYRPQAWEMQNIKVIS